MKSKLTIVVVTAVLTAALLFSLTSAYSWYMQRHYGGDGKMNTEIILAKVLWFTTRLLTSAQRAWRLWLQNGKGQQGPPRHPKYSPNRILPGEAIGIAYPPHLKTR